MKTFYTFILFVIFTCSYNIAQQASSYFPSQTGFTWQYLSTPLDSENNGISQLAFYRADSFANVENYQGKLANIVLSKQGDINSLSSLPYEDSLFFHFNDTTAYEVTQIGNQEYLLRTLDSLEIDTSFSFLEFFTSLENWYSMYRFTEPLNNEYLVFSLDTTLHNGIMTIPLRFEYLGKRLQEQTIITQIGTYNCIRFLIKKGVSLLIAPTIKVPIVFVEDTVWMAQNKWILKNISPSTYVDLSLFGSDPIFVPGLRTEIIEIISDVEESADMPTDIYLYQNYPNPFNPNTTINFDIPERSRVTLKLYDVLGNEVATLVSEEKLAGRSKVEFNAENLTSGVYYYRLQVSNFSETKKMILVK